MGSEEAIVRGMEGHVYVVSFQSGVVKVGHTGNPKGRLAGYTKDGVIHSNPVLASWVSPPHVNSWQNETRLIEFCINRGLLATGGKRGEYFTGIDFATVVSYAEALSFPRFDAAARERKSHEKIEKKDDTWRKWFGLDRRLMELPELITELVEGADLSEIERASLAAGWAAAIGISVDDFEAIRPEFGRRLKQFMLDAANMKRDAEFLGEMAERAQCAFEEHSTTAWAALGGEIQQRVRSRQGEAG